MMQNGEADGSYFAPDCFHFSSRGHAVGAKDLWNNMVSFGYKPTFQHVFEVWKVSAFYRITKLTA